MNLESFENGNQFQGLDGVPAASVTRAINRAKKATSTRTLKDLCGTMSVLRFATELRCLVASLGVIGAEESSPVEHLAFASAWDSGGKVTILVVQIFWNSSSRSKVDDSFGLLKYL